MTQSVKIQAPATVANVACGFDIMGFALEAPHDELIVRKTNRPGLRLSDKTGLGLPLDPRANTAGQAALALLEHLGSQQGFELEFTRKISPGSGIGSSAASAAAAVFGVNLLLGEPFDRQGLVQFAMQGEAVASGSAHADNVAPAVMGGFVLIRGYAPLDLVRLPYPKELHCAIVHPEIEIRTQDARRILKQHIPLKTAIEQWGNVAGLVAGLTLGDLGLIGRSLKDVVVEPVRSVMLPNFAQVKRGALEAGALGCSISGSGPSLFALCDGREVATRVAASFRDAFREMEIPCQTYVSRINELGAKAVL